MTPKMTLGVEAYLAARAPQNAANWALVGPPWPMIAPFHLASTSGVSKISEQNDFVCCFFYS